MAAMPGNHGMFELVKCTVCIGSCVGGENYIMRHVLQKNMSLKIFVVVRPKEGLADGARPIPLLV